MSGTDLSSLIPNAKLIIWDEAPMTNIFCFEALDRRLRDIVRDPNGSPSTLPFGGKTVVLGGDFRQILPVIPNGTRGEAMHSTIKSSYLCDHCKVLRLTKNIRLKNENTDDGATSNEITEFSNWILKIGDGDLGDSGDGSGEIDIPEEYLISDVSDPIVGIFQSIYPSVAEKYFEYRAILSPTYKDIEKINLTVLSLIPSDSKEYLSSDSLYPAEHKAEGLGQMYSVDYLNSIKPSGLPNHRLVLKVGVLIMLIRNIDPNQVCALERD